MRWVFIVALAAVSSAQTPHDGSRVLLIVNGNSDVSLRIGEMYAKRRGVPRENVCRIRSTHAETIDRSTYKAEVEKGVLRCLRSHPKAERIRFLATTKGVPLRIRGEGGREATSAAVDSELTLLPLLLRGEDVPVAGRVPNLFFARYREMFDPARHGFYPVTRLTGYSYEDVEALVSRCLSARNRGVFVLDQGPLQPAPGNEWLSRTARALPLDRVLLDRRNAVVYDQSGVIGYASWGSNDAQRQVDKRRFLGFEWLPGAIALEYVSTNARTFEEPPAEWTIGTWNDPTSYFENSPQTMVGDLIREGAAGASGHVYEPYLDGNPRPDFVLPAYYAGTPLAEAFYLGMPYLSWMNVVVGDPLCRLDPPGR